MKTDRVITGHNQIDISSALCKKIGLCQLWA